MKWFIESFSFTTDDSDHYGCVIGDAADEAASRLKTYEWIHAHHTNVSNVYINIQPIDDKILRAIHAYVEKEMS